MGKSFGNTYTNKNKQNEKRGKTLNNILNTSSTFVISKSTVSFSKYGSQTLQKTIYCTLPLIQKD